MDVANMAGALIIGLGQPVGISFKQIDPMGKLLVAGTLGGRAGGKEAGNRRVRATLA
jgi:hypothetical protein